jgi:Retroviral aspartyl protease
LACDAVVKARELAASEGKSVATPLKTNKVVNDCLTLITNGVHNILPVTFVLLRDTIGHCPLLTLLDSGSTLTWIAKRAIPASITLTKQTAIQGNTLAGSFSMTEYLPAQQVQFLELHPTMSLDLPASPVFEQAGCRYDIIMGRDLLQRASITISFVDNTIFMLESMIAMSTIAMCTHQQLLKLQDPQDLYLEMQDTLHGSFTNLYKVQYKRSEYKASDVREIVGQQCTHLDADKRNELYAVLSRFPDLFSGRLRMYPKEVHVDVNPTVAPSFQHHYAVPHHNLAVFRYEIDSMVSQDVVEKAEPAAWCSASFGVLKPNNTMQLVTDFCKLNVAVKQRSYTMPLIPQLLRKYSTYQYMTKLDMTMQFYTFVLDLESRQYCTFSTPFGLYHYK